MVMISDVAHYLSSVGYETELSYRRLPQYCDCEWLISKFWFVSLLSQLLGFEILFDAVSEIFVAVFVICCNRCSIGA